MRFEDPRAVAFLMACYVAGMLFGAWLMSRRR